MLLQALCIISSSYVNSNWSDSPETPNLNQNRRFFKPCDLAIWCMTLENNSSPLLCYLKLCVSFHNHWWIQTGVTVRKRPIWVESTIFRAVWPWNLTMTLKTNRAPLLCCFKLCASFRSHWWIQTGVAVQIRPIWVKFDNFFEPCDLEIWQMTLKNNRAPLLSNMELCASFHHHMCIQTGVTVQKRLSWVLTSVTLTFDLDLLHGPYFCHW